VWDRDVFANLPLYVNVNRSGFYESTTLMCGILVEKLTQWCLLLFLSFFSGNVKKKY